MNLNLLRILVLINLAITGFLCTKLFNLSQSKLDLSNEILKVKGLIVVDASGVERVILGAPLPDPTFHGYRLSRGENAEVSGLMLYDSEGQERGGYVTDDDYGNVFLTLDSKSNQQALFISEPQGGATMQVWGRNGNKLSMGAYDDTVEVAITHKGTPLKLVTDE